MIPVKDLFKYLNKMLSEKWGYIWGTAGIKWTAERQSKVSDNMAQQYGSKWIGHMVTDCSGVMVYIWKKYGLSIFHGSNTIARKYVGKLVKTPSPGYAAFKWKNANVSKFSDSKGDFYHIGIVGEDGKTVFESRGTKAGFTTSAASEWQYFAPFKDVDYKGGANTDMPETKVNYIGQVNTASGSLNVRSSPSTAGKIEDSLKKGTQVEVISQPNDDWLQIKYGNNKMGYVSKKYIIKVETPTPTPAPTPTPTPEPAPAIPSLNYGVFIPCINEEAAMQLAKTIDGAIITYYKSNGEGG